MAENKVSLYNQADLKNTSDDAIANYLNSLGFTQKHSLVDVRLALGYGAFAVSAACFLWDYKLGFENTKTCTAAAVAIYMVLQGALAYWTTFVENNAVYQGSGPSGEKITIASWTKKNEPVYNLKVTVQDAKKPASSLEVSHSFASWFDETGRFVAGPFQEFIASSVPLVGRLDPKRVKSASQEMLDANPELLDAILAANASAETTGTEKKTGGKRRKH